MFSSSTQLKNWTFSGNTELSRLRAEANAKFIETYWSSVEARCRDQYFLSPAEERMVYRHYEYVLKEFCTRFQPPMSRYSLGTAMTFMKRFYLHNSVMDYHPKDIIYTCAYLACKVEEFNVSIQQFVGNVSGDRERACDVILSQELLFMQQLHYHLTVHNPYRPMEGLLIDIKTRCPNIEDPEKLRKGADDFLDRSLHTEVCLIFAPSQIALAAILSSASKMNIDLDGYVKHNLIGSGDNENLAKTVEHIKRIRYCVKHLEPLNREVVRTIEQKLEVCRNQENNPDSDVYRQRVEDLWEEENERRTIKHTKKAEADRRANVELLGLNTFKSQFD